MGRLCPLPGDDAHTRRAQACTSPLSTHPHGQGADQQATPSSPESSNCHRGILYSAASRGESRHQHQASCPGQNRSLPQAPIAPAVPGGPALPATYKPPYPLPHPAPAAVIQTAPPTAPARTVPGWPDGPDGRRCAGSWPSRAGVVLPPDKDIVGVVKRLPRQPAVVGQQLFAVEQRLQRTQGHPLLAAALAVHQYPGSPRSPAAPGAVGSAGGLFTPAMQNRVLHPWACRAASHPGQQLPPPPLSPPHKKGVPWPGRPGTAGGAGHIELGVVPKTIGPGSPPGSKDHTSQPGGGLAGRLGRLHQVGGTTGSAAFGASVRGSGPPTAKLLPRVGQDHLAAFPDLLHPGGQPAVRPRASGRTVSSLRAARTARAGPRRTQHGDKTQDLRFLFAPQPVLVIEVVDEDPASVSCSLLHKGQVKGFPQRVQPGLGIVLGPGKAGHGLCLPDCGAAHLLQQPGRPWRKSPRLKQGSPGSVSSPAPPTAVESTGQARGHGLQDGPGSALRHSWDGYRRPAGRTTAAWRRAGCIPTASPAAGTPHLSAQASSFLPSPPPRQPVLYGRPALPAAAAPGRGSPPSGPFRRCPREAAVPITKGPLWAEVRPQPAAQHPGVQAGQFPHPNSRCWAPAVGYRFWRARRVTYTAQSACPQAAPAFAVSRQGGGQLARRPVVPGLPPRPGRSPRSDRACGSGAPTAGRCRHRRSPGPARSPGRPGAPAGRSPFSTCQRSRGQNQFDAGRYRSGRATQSARDRSKAFEPGPPPSGAGRRRGPAAAPPSGCRSADTGPHTSWLELVSV